MNYYFKKFRKINIIILKKLKKKNYFKSKLIALLNILKKILKIVITRRLNNYIKDNNLLLLK